MSQEEKMQFLKVTVLPDKIPGHKKGQKNQGWGEPEQDESLPDQVPIIPGMGQLIPSKTIRVTNVDKEAMKAYYNEAKGRL